MNACKDCGKGEEAYLYFIGASGDFAPLGIGATAMICHDCYYQPPTSTSARQVKSLKRAGLD